MKLRYEINQVIKFGMLFGYVIYDNTNKEYLPYEFNEDEKHLAQSKCDLKNELSLLSR